ncbi:MAG: PEP-CTERM sorting domain-containing protein [Phycisphaerae bacterium]|nr:PEP-CTERM sorting domain-containing protein [Phycisphaerae bacterium]
MNRNVWVAVAVAGLTALMCLTGANVARGDLIIYSDAFSGHADGGDDNRLAGTTTDVGGATWGTVPAATGTLRFAEQTGYGVVNMPIALGANYLALGHTATASDGILVAAARFISDSAGWTGVGLASGTGLLYASDGGGPWARVTADKLAAFGGPGNTANKFINEVTPANYVSGAYNVLEVVLDCVTAKASVYVNGAQVGSTFTYSGGILPTVNYFTIQVSGTDTAVKADWAMLYTETAPTANAGGVYSVAPAGSVSFDATASSDRGVTPNLSNVLTYAWGLDNDRLYDDATGATPASFTYDYLVNTLGLSAGNHTVGVQVTDRFGQSGTAASTLTISVPEPATMAFLALGGLTMIAGAIRRRRVG